MSTSQLLIALENHLTASSTAGSLSALLAGRLYCVHVPAETALPHLRWWITDQARQQFHVGGDDLAILLTFELHGAVEAGPATLLQINETLANLLDAQTLSLPTGVAAVRALEPGRMEEREGHIVITSRWLARVRLRAV